ncbi:MAG: hypothetical protein WCR42_14460 [bacterium]
MKPYRLILMVLLLVSFSNRLLAQYNDKAEVLAELNNLENEFGNSLVSSFYSISELRSFSLIQLDKTMVDYEHRWTTPEDISQNLSKKEKQILKASVADFLFDSEPNQRSLVISKMKSWCMADKLVQILFTSYGVTLDEFLKTSEKNFYTQSYIPSGTKAEESAIANMSRLEKNKMYHLVLNEIASLGKGKQLDYFSMMFKSLAQNYPEK